MSNFPENKFLATSKATNKQNTFIKPTPEGSPVLTLGIYYKGQGRTRTVPTNKMHPVGTVPTDKMHPVGTLKFKTG